MEIFKIFGQKKGGRQKAPIFKNFFGTLNLFKNAQKPQKWKNRLKFP